MIGMSREIGAAGEGRRSFGGEGSVFYWSSGVLAELKLNGDGVMFR